MNCLRIILMYQMYLVSLRKKKLIAVVEGSLETWNSRYRIWNVLVEQKYRRKGYGKMLFDHIEMVAKKKAHAH